MVLSTHSHIARINTISLMLQGSHARNLFKIPIKTSFCILKTSQFILAMFNAMRLGSWMI